MKKLFLLTLSLPFLFFYTSQDILSTKKGKVSFASLAEDHANIKAISNTGNCSINKQSGEMGFSVMIRDFKFEDAGMQDVFLQIMKSDQFPTAGFKGNITDLNTTDLKRNGDHPANVKGALTLHGVTKDMQTQCLLKVNGNTIQATAELLVNMKDFKIENPIGNDTIGIKIDCLF